LIAEKLEDVASGKIDRLMIFMPPRHGKSELASRRFPAWFLGNYSNRQIIGASYNSDLSSDFGREVRNIVDAPECRALFNTTLAPDSKAANRWHTEQGGQYVAAGVGTAITGRGAHVFLIDDPFKDRDEADSQVRRDHVYDWYRSTAYTRLMPGGAMILIQTRWHEDDLAGRLLKEAEEGGDQWEVLSLPAVQDEQALWPEWYDLEALDRIKRTLGSREWQALYQQSPQPEGGSYFQRDWLRWYDEPPEHLRIYGASDYAVTDRGGDYTVHGIAGVDPDDNLYILDWWREQTETDIWIDTFLDMANHWKPLVWAEERGQIIKSVGPFITRRMREKRVYLNREQFTSAADKPTRSRAIQARMSMGKVYLPKNAPWVDDLVSEMISFPAGKNDDQVDVMALFGRMLDNMIGASGAAKPNKPKPDRYERTREDSAVSWKTV